MCHCQETEILCPACDLPHTPRVNLPVFCPEATTVGETQVFGACDMPLRTYTASVGGQSRTRGPLVHEQIHTQTRQRFRDFKRVYGEQSDEFRFAMREYALACIDDAEELIKGEFDPSQTLEGRGWQSRSRVLAAVWFVRDGGEAYWEKLETLALWLLCHQCEPPRTGELGANVAAAAGSSGPGRLVWVPWAGRYLELSQETVRMLMEMYYGDDDDDDDDDDEYEEEYDEED
jgi:hypothetical protein